MTRSIGPALFVDDPAEYSQRKAGNVSRHVRWRNVTGGQERFGDNAAGPGTRLQGNGPDQLLYTSTPEQGGGPDTGEILELKVPGLP